jgi:predicted dehydrogenase
MDQIRWGVLGAGGIAATVSPDIAASPGSVLAAIASRDLDRATAFAEQHGVRRAYGSYQELVAAPDIDVVYIATTHAQHHEHALLALRAGKPVLVEKAFTLTAWQAREVVAEARARQLFCMEAMWMRLNPLILRAVEIAHSGGIGEILGVRADLSRHFPYDPQGRLYNLAVGGGALLDLGVYPVTFAWQVLGHPDVVQATGALAPTGSDVTSAVQWGYADGRFAQLQCSAAAHNPYGALITGTDGWIRLENRMHHPTAITVHAGNTEQVFPEGEIAGYRHQVAEVERCLREGLLESPQVPLDDTIAIMQTLDEARRQLGVRYAADLAVEG